MAQTVETLLMRLREKDDKINDLKRLITKLHDELVSAHSSLGSYSDELMRLDADISCLKASLATCFLTTHP